MKKLHRFLVKETPSGDSIFITETETVHIISHVLKLNVGEECILFTDGSDDYLCEISSIEKASIELKKLSTTPKIEVPKSLTACISIVKRDNFELIVQKLTELGIKNIIPIISDRTVKQSLRIDRLQKISDEALEQSGGSNRVQITEPISLKDALETSKHAEQCYFDIDGEPYTKAQNSNATFYIGPEGGWSDADKALFSEYSAKSYKLTETTLRAETATIIAASKLILS